MPVALQTCKDVDEKNSKIVSSLPTLLGHTKPHIRRHNFNNKYIVLMIQFITNSTKMLPLSCYALYLKKKNSRPLTFLKKFKYFMTTLSTFTEKSYG